MIWRVEIKDKKGIFDAAGESVHKNVKDLGINSVTGVNVVNVFLLQGDIRQSDAETICRDLLVDNTIQEYSCCRNSNSDQGSEDNMDVVEIAYNPGVMDPVEESTLKGIRDLGIQGVSSVRTAKKYILNGKISPRETSIIVDKVLSNKIIQHVVDNEVVENKSDTPKSCKKDVEVISVDIVKATGKKLLDISKCGQLFLNIDEMKTIQKHFKKLKRNPTDCELETIAQTWSEHCYHKTFRGNIDYQCKEKGKNKKTLIRNLLKNTIMKATKDINKSWCVSVFHDNAGIIKFDEDSDICFKVETHNHPSALEPFGGANTGIGGVIRDILGTGLGAKPICNTDVFCFAQPNFPFSNLPEGTLHPKRIMKGVVSGVRDYGNKMGIPTINGAIIFDKGYVGNPLVYCGTVGIMPKDKAHKCVKKGDAIVVVGGRTGRDGIHGATFSSGELTHESETISSGAVQIGDPIQEKKVLDALMQARDKNLYSAITDCGAGGLSSAVGEMGEKLGCHANLEKAPLKYKGLSYMEIWISESQERMVLSVPRKKLNELLKVFRSENVEATVIGEFTGSGRLQLSYRGKQVCDLDMKFLYNGIPRITKKAVWSKPKINDPKFKCPRNLTEKLHKALSHYNVCSKEWVIRQYDHEVQGGSIIKPLVGISCDGPSDASVIRPKISSKRGIAVSNGINARFGMVDPFWMAASCIDEAIRQIIAVGGSLDNIAILDNFCWGNPDKPDRLGGLVRAAQGCYKAAVSYKVPFISGKDSFNNEFAVKGKSISIPGTLLISAVGIINDTTKTVTMDFKREGSLIYIVGETFEELGGSIYFDTCNSLGSSVPKVDFKKSVKKFRALEKAIEHNLILSAHDCSDGGLAVALAEMAFSGGFGANIFLKEVPYKGNKKRNDYILFSESNSRFILEVPVELQKDFEKVFKDIAYGLIGCTQSRQTLQVYGLDGKVCLSDTLSTLKQSWQKPLRW